MRYRDYKTRIGTFSGNSSQIFDHFGSDWNVATEHLHNRGALLIKNHFHAAVMEVPLAQAAFNTVPLPHPQLWCVGAVTAPVCYSSASSGLFSHQLAGWTSMSEHGHTHAPKSAPVQDALMSICKTNPTLAEHRPMFMSRNTPWQWRCLSVPPSAGRPCEHGTRKQFKIHFIYCIVFYIDKLHGNIASSPFFSPRSFGCHLIIVEPPDITVVIKVNGMITH